MKALVTLTRWYLALQRPTSCYQFVQSVPFEYFLKSYFRTAVSRLSGLGGRPGTRALPATRSIQTANVGKVKQNPTGSRGGHGGLAQESLVARIARRYGHRDTQAATLSRQAVQRILALRQCVPLLGLTGLCLVDKPSLITPDEELEGVCVEIRNIVDKINFDVYTQSMLTIPEDKTISLSDFEIGDPIAKGCNAAVYRARYDPKEASCPAIREEDEELVDEIAGSPPLSSSPPRKYAAEFESPAGSVDVPSEVENATSMDSFDLAIKMMFNYDAASNSAAIWNSLSRECAPTANNQFSQTRDTHLPPHPCVVDIKVTFADRVPLLRGAQQLYPQALPPRLNDQGIGRNATMFLVMKRYNCSLRGFLRMKAKQNEVLSDKVKLSLCAQLFEAVAHLVQHGVAHRDLKSDNVLVDIGNRPGETQLALSDFGCCLIPADCITPLKLAYPSKQVSKGGNLALMPPEVQTAQAGLLSYIDYSRADLWSIATLVYEIYGQENPFFEGHLLARTYTDQDIPDLIGAPPVVQALVKQCLKRDPSQRPSPGLAATIFQMLLHAPQHLFSRENTSSQHVVQWLCDLAVDALFAARKEEANDRRSVSQSLKRMFLARVYLHTVLEAIEFVKSCNDSSLVQEEARQEDVETDELDGKAKEGEQAVEAEEDLSSQAAGQTA